jgi:hypothetical protein
MYVLGASFNVPMMETEHRQHVVANFEHFLQQSQKENNYFNMLARWCPEKVGTLVMDAMAHERTKAAVLDNAYNGKILLMHDLINHCKGVRIKGQMKLMVRRW